MSGIPAGYTSVTPYIIFDNLAEVIDFYKKALGAKIIMTIPSDSGDITHAEIQIGNATLMLGTPRHSGDNDTKMQSAKAFQGSPVSFYIYVNDLDDFFKRAKDAGMQEIRKIENMFWGDRMGSLRDPFYIDWAIAEYQGK